MNEMITNWILLVDCTENMKDNDFRPSRFQVALKGVQKFIQMKFKFFPKEFLSIYLFSNKTQILAQLSRDSQSILKQLMSQKFLKTHKPEGNGEELYFALEHAVNFIRSQIQLIGGQKSRIIIITGLRQIPMSVEMEKLVKIIEGLNIYVDLFIFTSKKKENASRTINFSQFMEKLNGEINIFTSKKDYYEKIISYAKQKDKLKEAHLIPQSSSNTSDSLMEIAQDLRKPTNDEIIQMKDPLSMLRCQICFSKKSPITHKSLKVSGRFCPHCGIPMHLSCAGTWTDKTDEGANLFRCPYCYTLLKVPMYILKGIRSRKFLVSAEDKAKFVVKMIKVKEISPQIESLDCAYCNKPLFNKEEKKSSIFRCSHCNAHYHIKCLEKMYKKSKTCENCGRKII
ncbi:MAG: VWA domain-containing protein [Candidatus Lokiarchaeota archaeon]|nr:VWA domain-containing protein [Candidatus Harpocratesius repetitus]